MRPRPSDREPFIHSVTVLPAPKAYKDDYPFDLPVIKQCPTIALHPAVTFLIGENGSGKSTLIEAIAVRMDMREEGGEGKSPFMHREPEGGLHDSIQFNTSRYRRTSERFFLRAETVYNLATELDSGQYSGLRKYGGRSLHDRSHGEAFLAIIQNRMGGESFFLMDEPEAALSPTRQLTLLREIDLLVRDGCQFVIATHSPILMAYPDARIYELGEHGIRETTYTETEHYQITKTFLERPEAYLRHLIE